MAGTIYPDMWVDPEDDPREGRPVPVGERAILTYYLRSYRLTLEMKCQGLDAEQLARRSVPPSTLSLLGLIRHMAMAEHNWFRRVLEEQPDLPRLYETAEDRDADFNEAVADPAVIEDAFATWKAEIANAEQYAEANDLDRTVPVGGAPSVEGDPNAGTITLREVLVHMIEEYARHCGHADLLRECIDGATGQ